MFWSPALAKKSRELVQRTANQADLFTFTCLKHTGDGDIDAASPNQDWTSCSGFAAEFLWTVEPEDLDLQGDDCGITKAQVDALYP